MWILTMFLITASGDKVINSYGHFESASHCHRVAEGVKEGLSKEYKDVSSLLVCSKLKEIN